MAASNDPDPYRPPPIGGPGAVDGSPVRLKAVAIGVAVDWVATYAATFAILVVASAIAVSRYQSEAEIAAYMERLRNAPDFVILTSLVGLACVTLGAFVAARVAQRDEIRHAALVGALSLVLGLALSFGSDAEGAGWSPAWFEALGHALVVPAALLGGVAASARDGEATGSDGPLAR